MYKKPLTISRDLFLSAVGNLIKWSDKTRIFWSRTVRKMMTQTLSKISFSDNKQHPLNPSDLSCWKWVDKSIGGYGSLEPLVKANLGFYIFFLQNSIHFEYGLVWNAFSHWLKCKDGQNPKLQVHSPEVIFKPSTGNYLHCNFPGNLANRRKTLSKPTNMHILQLT